MLQVLKHKDGQKNEDFPNNATLAHHMQNIIFDDALSWEHNITVKSKEVYIHCDSNWWYCKKPRSSVKRGTQYLSSITWKCNTCNTFRVWTLEASQALASSYTPNLKISEKKQLNTAMQFFSHKQTEWLVK